MLWTRYRVDFDFFTDSGLLSANLAELRARGIDTDSLSDTVAARMRALLGVRTVFTPRTLWAADPADAEAGFWR